MKKLSFLFVLIYMTTSNLNAQDIVFTFNARDAINTIDSIKATKVETGETAFVEGSNTINMSSFTTGTKLIPTNSEEISIYPNPFENYTQLIFHSYQNDNIKVSLINAAGQIVAEKNQNITSGIHQFNISTNNNGLYILNIAGTQTNLSQKIISTKNNQSQNKIEYNGYSSIPPIEKSAKAEGGEIIHFYVYSGDNITKIVDSPTESKTYEVEFYECKDTDGKSYPIVQIGDQWWMAENNAYLPEVFPVSDFSKEKRYYVYDYSRTNVSIAKLNTNYKNHGVLYNWSAAKESCPTGWHLPTKEEWSDLYYVVGGNISGYKLKSNSGWNDNGNGINEYGFEALPSGMYAWDGSQTAQLVFMGMGDYGAFWSGTSINNDATYTGFSYNSESGFFAETEFLEYGFSVRCVKSFKDDATNPDENKKLTQEEYMDIINNASIGQKGSYFINMLKNATIQFNDSSKLTMFVIVDNPYIKDVITHEESYLKNHIVKGTYHLKDFGANTELTAINGEKITIKNVNPETKFYYVNNASSCEMEEVEINGNIVHYIYAPILTGESDYDEYFKQTKEKFAEFIEYSNYFDAVLTNISDGINSSWEQIGNHTFSADNEIIEKLWIDAYYLLYRMINLKIYNQESDSDVFAENSLLQSAVTSVLLNYFGGIPIYQDPSQFNDQTSRASVEEVFHWTIHSTEQADSWTNNIALKNAAKAIKSRVLIQLENFPQYTEAAILCESIINSGLYSLESDSANIYSAQSTENIYFLNNPQKISSDISTQKSVLPICRISESYLKVSFCRMKEGRLGEAMDHLKYYQEMKGYEVSEFDPSVLNEKLKEYWLSEFTFEGLRFATLKKFEITGEILEIPEHMKLLPIPLKELNYNPNIFQNPGY